MSVVIHLISHEAGFCNQCYRCDQIHSRGQYVLGLEKKDGGRFLLSANPPPTCCGKSLSFVQVFSTKKEAEVARETLIANIAHDSNLTIPAIAAWFWPSHLLRPLN